MVTTDKVDDFAPSLGIDVMKSRMTLQGFSAELLTVLKKRFTNFRKLGQTPFSAQNAQGLKFVTDYGYPEPGIGDVRTLYYMFENSRKEKVVVTCRVAMQTGDRFDAAFDEMVRSLMIK